MPGGRPLHLAKKYGTPEAVDAACTEWIEAREAAGKPLTYSGLALHLGMDTRSLWNYANDPTDEGERAEFFPPIKRALQRIQDGYEALMHGGKPVGAIFALKNVGWTDRQEVGLELSGDGWGALLDRVRARPGGSSGGNSD